jgi:hypothetical protein
MFAQQQPVGAQLDPLWLVGTLGVIWRTPALVVHWDGLVRLSFHEINLRGQAQLARGQRHRAGLEGALVFLARKRAALAVHPPVGTAPLHREGVVRELALDPLQVEQPRAVGELIEHPDRKELPSFGGLVGSQRHVSPRVG